VCLVGLIGQEYRKLASAIPTGFEPWKGQEGSRRGSREQRTVENGRLSRSVFID
jgi:hypothetical protein